MIPKTVATMASLVTPIVLILLAFTLACAGVGSTPEIRAGDEPTHDGLYRLDHAHRFQRVWVRPGSSLAGYDKLLPISAGIHYKRPPRRVHGEHPLSESQLTKVEGLLGEVFEEEVTADGAWAIVSEVGPDVLIIRGALIDLVVTAPPESTSGRTRSYSTSVAEATLVIEIFDSESREILVRVADRRSIDHDSGSWRNSTINNRSAAKRAFRNWARRLQQGLEIARDNRWPTLPSVIPADSN